MTMRNSTSSNGHYPSSNPLRYPKAQNPKKSESIELPSPSRSPETQPEHGDYWDREEWDDEDWKA